MSVMFKIGIQFFYLHISLKNILLFSVYPFNFSALFLALCHDTDLLYIDLTIKKCKVWKQRTSANGVTTTSHSSWK